MKLRTGAQQKPATPKGKAGTPPMYFGNSRGPVHPNFDRHSHVGAKKERKD